MDVLFAYFYSAIAIFLSFYLFSWFLAVLYSLKILMSLIILISLVELAPILDTRDTLASLTTFDVAWIPSPVIKALIHTKSKSIDSVEIKSSQK